MFKLLNSKIFNQLLVCSFIAIFAMLTGCNGDFNSSKDENTNDNNNTDPIINPNPENPIIPPHTIAISYPLTNAIENLGAGFYRRLAGVIVTDQDGNAVDDGFIIDLNIIDSILVKGFIAPVNGDTISGSTIVSQTLFEADGITPTDLTSANVNRNYAYRFIERFDRVFLFNADEIDKNHIVNAVPDSSNTLLVSRIFSQSYPAFPYTGLDFDVSKSKEETPRTTQFIVGASLMGAEIAGVDENGNPTTGSSVTKDGIARFTITYPANEDTILTGCGISAIDERVSPLGSGDVMLVASVRENDTVTSIDDRFCFSAISGGSLVADTDSISSSGIITLFVRDGGDQIPLPYVSVRATVVDANQSDILLTDFPAPPISNQKSGSRLTGVGGSVSFAVDATTLPADDSKNATIEFTLSNTYSASGSKTSVVIQVVSDVPAAQI